MNRSILNFKELILIIALCPLFFMSACGDKARFIKKKVFYINSYHKGFQFSDEMMQGITENLSADSFEIKSYFLDAKRITDELIMYKNVKSCLDSIEAFSPDIIIASDDNAVKDVIVPNFKDKSTPVVFCGVNWNCSQYGLPTKNITGILEVWPIKQMLKTVSKYYPEARKLMVLGENTISEQKNCSVLDSLYKNLGWVVNYELVSNFDDWKEKFALANKTFDVIYLTSNGGIKSWDSIQAKKYIEEHLKIPVIASDDFMMPYAVFGITKIISEQGEWAAKTAKKILNGTNPSQIPVARNKKNQYWLNTEWAMKIGFRPDTAILKKCKLINIDK